MPTSVDPCQLVTSQEASQLAGASFGAGKEETTSGNGRLCVYGYQTLNVFTVEVAQAPNLAAAQAAKAEALAGIQEFASKRVTLTQLPNLADGAVVAQGGAAISGQTFSVSSIGVLKGTIFFGFSDLVLGHPAPSSAALQARLRSVSDACRERWMAVPASTRNGSGATEVVRMTRLRWSETTSE